MFRLGPGLFSLKILPCEIHSTKERENIFEYGEWLYLFDDDFDTTNCNAQAAWGLCFLLQKKRWILKSFLECVILKIWTFQGLKISGGMGNWSLRTWYFISNWVNNAHSKSKISHKIVFVGFMKIFLCYPMWELVFS